MIENVHFVELVELNNHLMISDQAVFYHIRSTRQALRSERFRSLERDRSTTPLAETANCCSFLLRDISSSNSTFQ
ncbi:hypothetical protein RHMOL_Rhmol07G0263500 [Rhododendron molle]|uniref:Uncharacterized protein n=1 Tax=Rhododendron molle TaxID=49168 RepID=A0ACC0N614_RHOML|nr:hypothetical protein RHMOL_Rhmol07G0263500 [Rhododendron molle]